MYYYSHTSKKKLASTDPDLQRLFNEVIKVIDCTIIFGHRTKEEQEEMVRKGYSKLHFPKSNHNKTPSLAVDVAPYPIDWSGLDQKMVKEIATEKDYNKIRRLVNRYQIRRARFYYLAGIVKGIAAQLDIKMRWGGDWDSDNDFADQSWNDLPHYELLGK